MQITLSPVRSDAALTLERRGDTLIINGVPLDMSGIPDGAVLSLEDVTDCPWLVSDITRTGGALHLTLMLPHAQDAPPDVLFPAPIHVVGDGPVAVPPHRHSADD